MKKHIPVLLDNVLEVLAPRSGEVFADLTAGYGGHSEALLERVGDTGFGYLFDRDPEAVEYLQTKFTGRSNVKIIKSDFGDIDWQVFSKKPDMILADIGVSSPQIDSPERGFSFSSEGALDMRMDATSQLTAYDIVNGYTEKDIADILYKYGEERQSRAIASEIVKQRNISEIKTTTQLADIISNRIGRHGKINSATKSFQALRIAVNDELGELDRLLKVIPEEVSIGGRVAIISFHSLEDRMVKRSFKSLCTPRRNEFGQIETDPEFSPVTKKPITGDKFNKSNPRARSAKLRAVEKIN